MIRRVIAYTLIAVGVMCAALLSLAINLASSDLHDWLPKQPWYDPKLLWISAGLLVGFGVILAILRAPSTAPKKTPTKLTVEAGIVDPRRYLNPPEGTTTADEASALYLLDIPEAATAIVQCLIRITNTGEQGLNGVRVQIEYPHQYIVDEGVIIKLEKTAAVLGEPYIHKGQHVRREISDLEGVVRASYRLGNIGLRETVIIPEPLKFRRPCANEQPRETPTPLAERLGAQPTAIDYLRLRVFVFAQETHGEGAFDIFAFHGATDEALRLAIDGIRDAIWNGIPPEPGGYITSWGRTLRLSRLEISAPLLKPEIPGHLYQEVPMAYELLGITAIPLPHCDFRHTHDRAPLGHRIHGPKTTKQEITLLKPLPPKD